MNRHPRQGGSEDDARDDDASVPGKVRLDKWLWAARFFKTRAQAAEAIDGGKVEVNGDRAKRAKQVQAGDRVRLRHGPTEWQLIVRDIAERRGSAEIAQRLYVETDEGRAARERLAAERRSMPTAFAYGDGKPAKHERRALRKLKGD